MRRTQPGQLSISVYYLAAFVFAALLGGCFAFPEAQEERLFSLEELSKPYNEITLKTSLTIDALPKIQRFQSDRGPLLGGAEVLSEGKNTVATTGQSKDGRRTWFNMVVFHEFKLNVIRKYFFVVDEGRPSFGVQTDRGMKFNCQVVLDKKVLSTSYASENLRKIAILEHVLENLREDVKEVGAQADSPVKNNKMLGVCGMLVNQALELIVLKLDSSPVLATKLGTTDGIDFDHIIFGEGKVRMDVQSDMAAVSFRFGDYVEAERKLQ